MATSSTVFTTGFPLAHTVPFFFPAKGRDRNFIIIWQNSRTYNTHLTKQKPELLMQLLFRFMHFHFHQCVICYDVAITFTVRSLFVSVYCACLLGCILYRMITVMTNSLLNTKLKLNTSSVPRSEQASPYNFPIHCLSKWWCIYKSMLKYAEIAYT